MVKGKNIKEPCNRPRSVATENGSGIRSELVSEHHMRMVINIQRDKHPLT